MNSHILASTPGRLEPRWPGTNIPAAQPLPPGSTVDTTVTNTGLRWDTTKAIEYLSVIGKAADQAQRVGSQIGVTVPAQINIPAVVASITAGAGVGALFGGVGAPVGAVVGLLIGIYQLFAGSRSPSPYGNAAVEAWATAYAPTAFVNAAIESGRAGWTTIDQIARDCIQWFLDTDGLVLTGADRQAYYSGIPNHIYVGSAGNDAVVSEMYANAGIDYYATKELRTGGASMDVVQFVAKVRVPGQDGGENDSTEGTNTGLLIGAGLVTIGAIAYLSRSNS